MVQRSMTENRLPEENSSRIAQFLKEVETKDSQLKNLVMTQT